MTDITIDTTTETKPNTVGTALARAKELRDGGDGEGADKLLADFFASEAAERAKAEEAARVAKENLARLTAKKARHAATHKAKELPKPWNDPLLAKHIKDFNVEFGEVIATLGKVAVSEAGADFGPVADGFRGVPQKGSFSPPRVVLASWIESALECKDDEDFHDAVDAVALRIENKIDALMLTSREYVCRAIHIIAYCHFIVQHDGDFIKAQAEMEAEFTWLTAYDPAAVFDQTEESEVLA